MKIKFPLLALAFIALINSLLNAQSATPDQIPQLKQQLNNAKLSEKAAICNELSFAWGRKNTDSSLHYASLALELANQTSETKEALRAMNLRGDALMKKTSCDEARIIYQNALKAAKDASDQEMQARALHNLGKQAQICPNNGDPLPYYEEAYRIREKIGDKAGLSSTCLNLGALYGHFDINKSMFYNEKAMLLKEELGDRVGQATILANLAGQKLAQEQWEEARVLLEKAVVLNQELGNDKGLAITYGKLANVYQHLSNLPLALSYHKKGVALLEKFDGPGDLSVALRNLGTAYTAVGEYLPALELVLRAESLARNLERPDFLAEIWLALADIKGFMRDEQEAMEWYQKALNSPHLSERMRIFALYGASVSSEHLKNYNEGLKYVQSAYALAEKLQLKDQMRSVLISKASILYQLKRLPEALAAIRGSIELVEQNKGGQHLSEAYKIRSAIYSAMGGEKEVLALEDAQKAVFMAQKSNDLLLLMGALDRLSQACQALGKTDEAILYLRQAEALKDSLYSLSTVKNMTKKELTHEFDKERAIQKAEKEKEAAVVALALQRQRNIKWSLAAGLFFLLGLGAFIFTRLKEQQRRRSETMRQKIARDLHDEMGSTLSSISILSEAAQKNTLTEDAASPLNTISERTRQVMDTMSDIVWSVNPKNDEFGSVVMRMREFAAETLEAKNIILQFNSHESLQELELPMELRKDFYLLFKEAINNAAKYAQAQHVWVNLNKHHHEIRLEIKDDGHGFDPDKVKMGNGLQNMRERADRLKGNFSLNAKENEGTQIILTFPFT